MAETKRVLGMQNHGRKIIAKIAPIAVAFENSMKTKTYKSKSCPALAKKILIDHKGKLDAMMQQPKNAVASGAHFHVSMDDANVALDEANKTVSLAATMMAAQTVLDV